MNNEIKNRNWHEVNCLGLKCPLPVLRLENALSDGHSHIKIITDDPISIVDIPHAANQNDIILHEKHEISGQYTFFLENPRK